MDAQNEAGALLQEYASIFPVTVLNNLTGVAAPDGAAANATQGLLELDEYLAGFWYTWHRPSFFRHLFAGVACLSMYFVLAATVFARRMYLRQCILFKVAHRAHGRYVIPSVFDTFTISVVLFALTNIAYVATAYRAYHLRDNHAQQVIRLFEILQWTPLFFAGWFASVGSFYTAPGALDGPPQLRSRANQRRSSSKEWRQTLSARLRIPLLINIVTLGMPLVMTASVIPCAITSQRAHLHGFALYQRFHADVILPLLSSGSSSSGAPLLSLEAGLPTSIMQRAAEVRNAALHEAYYLAASFYAWTGGAAMVLAFYLPCGGILLVLIWRQVRRQREVVRSGIGTYKQQGGTMRKDLTETPATLHRWCINCGQKMAANAHCECGFVVGSAVEASSRSQDSADFTRERNDAVEEDNADLVRMAAAFKGRVVKQQGTPLLRYFYLRRCLLNLAFLYLSIVATAFSVLVAAGIFGAHVRPSMALGPAHFTRLYVISGLLSNWSLLVFGSLATAAIWLRHFDPANDPSYYARAGETGWAPSTALAMLGMRQLPKPLQRWLPALHQGEPLPTSPSTTHIMRSTTKLPQSPSMASSIGGGGAGRKRRRSTPTKVRRFSGLFVATSKFKHVMQDPPAMMDDDDDEREEKRREVQFEMMRTDPSPVSAMGTEDSPTGFVSSSTTTSPQSVVPWASLRRSPSALSMGTAKESGTASNPNLNTYSTCPTPPPPLPSTQHITTPPSAASANAGSHPGQTRAPVRYATPFGPIEGPPVSSTYLEPSSSRVGTPTTGVNPALNGFRRSPSLSKSIKSATGGDASSIGARQGLGLSMVGSSPPPAGVGVGGDAATGSPGPTGSVAAAWNERFTALRRSTMLLSSSSRPGTSDSLAPSTHLLHSSSLHNLRAQALRHASDPLHADQGSQQQLESTTSAQTQRREQQLQEAWNPGHWRTSSYSSGPNGQP
ncbi:hypothetical protein OC835_006036 [Tilletia horrida]|nr:hypothetical protein OC835_006036 [Tilletia horrida]